MSREVPGWDGYNVRTDGTQVVQQPLPEASGEAAEYWVIVPHDGCPAIVVCPCCDRPFRTALAAKRVCNIVYPLPEAQA